MEYGLYTYLYILTMAAQPHLLNSRQESRECSLLHALILDSKILNALPKLLPLIGYEPCALSNCKNSCFHSADFLSTFGPTADSLGPHYNSPTTSIIIIHLPSAISNPQTERNIVESHLVSLPTFAPDFKHLQSLPTFNQSCRVVRHAYNRPTFKSI